MSDKDNPDTRVSRRQLLANAAGTGLVTAVGVGTVTGEGGNGPVPGQSLHGKKVFRGPDMNMKLPEKANPASMGRADVALLSTNTRLSDEEIVGNLNSETTVSLIGSGAERRAIGTLYQTSPDAVMNGEEMPSSVFDGTAGLEYSDSPTGQVVLTAVGDDDGKKLRTVKQSSFDVKKEKHRSLGRNEALVAVDAAVTGNVAEYRRNRRAVVRRGRKNDGNPKGASVAGGLAALSGVLSDPDEDPDGDTSLMNDWKGIGEDVTYNNLHYDGTYIGDADKTVRGGYAPSSLETDSDDDYFLFRTIQSIDIPGDNGEYADAEGMRRKFTIDVNNINNYEQIPQGRWGPQQTNTTSSETVSMGLSTDVETVGANLGYSYTTTSKEVEVTKADINDIKKDIDGDGSDERIDRAEHLTKWNIQNSAANAGTIPGEPGHQVEVNPGESIIGYTFDSKWTYSVLEWYGTSLVRINDSFSNSGGALWER